MDAEQTARKIALRIRERHLLNVALAAIAGKEGALREACDLAEQAIATALRVAAAPAWRFDMENAPRDGSAVLIFADGEVGFGWYDDGLDPDGNPYEEPGWYWFDQHEQGPTEPTAWQPLPSPPSQGGGR